VPVCPGPNFPFAVPNSFVMRSSGLLLPQALCNLHFRISFGSAHSKRLTATELSAQLFYPQHLRDPRRTAHSKGLITPLESALTKISPVTPLECAVPESGGGSIIVNLDARRTTLPYVEATNLLAPRLRDSRFRAPITLVSRQLLHSRGFEVEFSFVTRRDKSLEPFRRIA